MFSVPYSAALVLYFDRKYCEPSKAAPLKPMCGIVDGPPLDVLDCVALLVAGPPQ